MGAIRDRHESLAKAPLVYTLFMLRFPKVASLVDATADSKIILTLGDKLKRSYPISETSVSQGISVEMHANRPQVKPINAMEFLFSSPKRETGISLTPDRLVFHTVKYKDFPDFRAKLKEVLDVIVDVLEISFFNAVGLRFIDAIYGSSTNPLDALKPSLQPFKPAEVESPLKHLNTQTTNLFETDLGRLIFKVYFSLRPEILVPPDLQEAAFKLNLEPRTSGNAPVVLLDFDHNYTITKNMLEELQINPLLDRLEKMHNISSQSFLLAVEEEYLEKHWK